MAKRTQNNNGPKNVLTPHRGALSKEAAEKALVEALKDVQHKKEEAAQPVVTTKKKRVGKLAKLIAEAKPIQHAEKPKEQPVQEAPKRQRKPRLSLVQTEPPKTPPVIEQAAVVKTRKPRQPRQISSEEQHLLDIRALMAKARELSASLDRLERHYLGKDSGKRGQKKVQ